MKSKRKIFFWATIYKVILEVSYIKIASPIFSYMGLIYTPKLVNLVISYVLFYVLLLLLPNNQNKPSHQLIQLLFLNSMVPFLSIFWLTANSLKHTLIVSLCYAFIFIFLRNSKPWNIPLLKNDTNLVFKITNAAFLLSVVLLVFRTLKYGGIDSRAFDFGTVYDLREEIQYNGIWQYLNNWLGKLLIPLCIIMYMMKKKWIFFLLSCSLQIVLYLSTGSKTILFSVVLLICTAFILRKGFWDKGISILFILMISVSDIFYKITNNIWLISLTIVRQFTLPPIISYKYYDFFNSNAKLNFSEGLIGTLFNIRSPYDIKAAYLISGSIGNHENTGFLSDAYSNGGIIAMIIISLAFILILLLVDSISRYSNKPYIYTALMCYQIIMLNDASLLTTLSTGGLFILLVIIYIIASEEKLSNEFSIIRI